LHLLCRCRQYLHQRKQAVYKVEIAKVLIDEGFDISRATINVKLAKIRDKKKEVYIRLQYDFT